MASGQLIHVREVHWLAVLFTRERWAYLGRGTEHTLGSDEETDSRVGPVFTHAEQLTPALVVEVEHIIAHSEPSQSLVATHLLGFGNSHAISRSSGECVWPGKWVTHLQLNPFLASKAGWGN